MSSQSVKAVINYTSVDGQTHGSNGQATHIPFIGDADDMQAKPVSVSIQNGRHVSEKGELSLEKEGFIMTRKKTDLTADDLFGVQKKRESYIRLAQYHDEMKELIKNQTGAPYVHVFSHQARDKSKADEIGLLNPFADQDGVSGYADVVHTDFCSKKALEKLLQGVASINMSKDPIETGSVIRPTPQEITNLLAGRYMLINCWRNISDEHPIMNDHLACCAANSVDIHSDMVRCDVPLKNKVLDIGASSLELKVPAAEQYRLIVANSSKHQWYYFPEMVKDEVLIFKQFDSDPAALARFCFHTSFSICSDITLPQRQSVEVRAIAFFPDANMAIRNLSDMQILNSHSDCNKVQAEDIGGRCCNATTLSFCSCACESPESIPETSIKKKDCGCPNSSNPYHACVEACGCTCTEPAHTDEYTIPQWLETLYGAEDHVLGSIATRNVIDGLSGKSQSDRWQALLSDQVVLRHSSTTCGNMHQVRTKALAISAASSSQSSALNRCTYLKRYRDCRKGQALDNASCGIVEGEFTYDHKLSRDQLVVPFTAHIVFDPMSKLIMGRHTFFDGVALEEFCRVRATLWRTLEMSLYAGASHGYIPHAEVPSVVDTVALHGAQEACVTQEICQSQGVSFRPDDWTYLTGL